MAKGPKPTPGAQAAAIVAAVLLVGVVLVLIASFTPIFYFNYTDPEDRLPLVAVLLALGLVGYLIYRNAVRIAARIAARPSASRGRRFEIPAALIVPCLAESDYPCPRCAYNLRGLTTPACPECNEPVRLAMIDYKARNPGGGFGLVLTWLLVTTLCTLLMSAFAVRSIFFMYTMMTGAGGGGFGGPGMAGGSAGMPMFLIPYMLVAILPVGTFIVCIVRLCFLFGARGEAAARWTRSTVLALSIVTVCWMLPITLISALSLLW